MTQLALTFNIKADTDKARVLALLKSQMIVTNADLKAHNLDHTGRNRISDLRRDDGYVIAQKGAGQGDDWLKNAYRIVWHPGETPDPQIEDALRADGWWIRPEEWRKKR